MADMARDTSAHAMTTADRSPPGSGVASCSECDDDISSQGHALTSAHSPKRVREKRKKKDEFQDSSAVGEVRMMGGPGR